MVMTNYPVALIAQAFVVRPIARFIHAGLFPEPVHTIATAS